MRFSFRKFLLASIFALTTFQVSSAQFVYGYLNGQLAMFDLSNCQICNLFPLPGNGLPDVVVLPDGSVVYSSSAGTCTVYSSQGSILGTGTFGQSVESVCYHNGVLYVAVNDGLYTIDLVTYQTSFIGNWASGMPTLTGLYSLNGVLYGMELSNSTPRAIWQINTTTPSASTFVQNMAAGTLQPRGVAASNGTVYYATGGPFTTYAIWSYNQATNTSQQLCTTPNTFWGIWVEPVATAPLNCFCSTDAGMLAGNSTTICGTGDYIGSPAIGSNLDGNDILRYFLVSNAQNPATTVVASSASPTFSFNPATMSLNTVYYFIAGAGNEINGNLDFSDPCLDFSHPISVVWRPQPTLAISGGGNVCEGGCITLTVVFSGTPPFSITYDTPYSTGQIQGFALLNNTFQVCPPQSAIPGPGLFQVTSFNDAFCICP